MLIVLVKKKKSSFILRKKYLNCSLLFSLFSVPTTVPAQTTTPKGKKDKTISEVAMMVMMMMITIL